MQIGGRDGEGFGHKFKHSGRLAVDHVDRFTIFGFLFEVFSDLKTFFLGIWPIDHMTTLPFLGKLNTVFIVVGGVRGRFPSPCRASHYAGRGKNMKVHGSIRRCGGLESIAGS